MKPFLSLLILLTITCSSYGQTPPIPPSSEIAMVSVEALQADAELLQEAMLSLHPGLYRFQSSETVDQLFNDLKASMNTPMTHQEAFLTFSRFVPKLLCGHTMVNPYNQDALIKQLIINTSDKLPFEFQLVDQRMVVTRSATDRIQDGMEILSINGMPTADLVNQLKTYASSDGSNEDKRIYELQLTGIGDYELADIYVPLLSPPDEKGYLIEAKSKAADKPMTTHVQPMSRADRQALLTEKYGPRASSHDELWTFEMLNDSVGHLRIGTFATYKMSMDWQGFLRETFNTLKTQEVPNLILDLRGNSGGMDVVGETLLRNIGTRPVTIPATETRIAYQQVPESIRPHVGTWDDRAFDLSTRTQDTGKGYYVSNNTTPKATTYPPNPDAYQGKVYLLVDAANSSNTFFVAKTAKQNQLATLVGEPTGGNLMGTNGGQMFFLNLPNSKVEVDIPIYGNFPLDTQPDRGIIPDIMANRTVEDVQNGVDTILQAALAAVGQ